MQVTYIGSGYPAVILKSIITLADISNKHKCFVCLNFAFYHLDRRYLITFSVTLSIGCGVGIRS